MTASDAPKGVLFWREGFNSGKSGHFVRGAALNEVVSKWIAEGIPVVAILIDPEHGANVNVLIQTEAQFSCFDDDYEPEQAL